MTQPSHPLSAQQIVDRYFLDNRARLIEIAAFLDRYDRAPGSGEVDFRVAALKKALAILVSTTSNRAEAVQLAFSDPTTEPRASAAGMKGAAGAYKE